MEPPQEDTSSVETLSSDRVVLVPISNDNALCKSPSTSNTKLSIQWMYMYKIMKDESLWTVFRVSSSKLGLDVQIQPRGTRDFRQKGNQVDLYTYAERPTVNIDCLCR